MTRGPGRWWTVVALVIAAAVVPSRAVGQTRKGSEASCRTGLETYRIVTTSPGGFTATVDGRCTFGPATVESTCTNLYSDTTGQRYTSVSVTRHASRGDIVDEVSVNPPRSLALGTTTRVTGAGLNTSNTSTLIYDSRRRLTGIAAAAQAGAPTSTTAYTAWDAAGRPTQATVTAGGKSTVQAIAYNEASRTQSMTTNGVTCTQSFDENANPAVGRCAGSTATTTVLTTQQICR